MHEELDRVFHGKKVDLEIRKVSPIIKKALEMKRQTSIAKLMAHLWRNNSDVKKAFKDDEIRFNKYCRRQISEGKILTK